jgi:Cd(II)/Pb(II)-responsive transcriptional regulator
MTILSTGAPKLLKIGAVAAASGTPVETIRFYEREGLLAAAARTESNYRTYGTDDVERIRFIRRCRSLDMALPEIRALLLIADRPAQSCVGVNGILDAHIGHVSARIRELKDLERALKLLRQQCAEPRAVAGCGILRGLGGGDNSVAFDLRDKQSQSRGTHRYSVVPPCAVAPGKPPIPLVSGPGV